MPIDRRSLAATFLGLGVLWPAAARAAGARRTDTPQPRTVAAGPDAGPVPDAGHDQTGALQAAIDRAAERRVALQLAPGRYRVRGLRLRPGTILSGGGHATLEASGPGAILRAEAAHGVRLDGLRLAGAGQPADDRERAGLVAARGCRDLDWTGLVVEGGSAHGLVLEACGGRIARCRLTGLAQSAIFSLDAAGLAIADNDITDCANNGILVWRTTPGEDGSLVSGNRIQRIAAAAGGTGQNGNGINVYRAGSVMVQSNRIVDCAYSAVRGNAASNIQIIGNTAQRIGEVALYAEFGFEGALIASNVVDGAATGVSVTNFNEGGRLAVVQGNLIRNLVRREHEPQDKRGEGIAVEADSVVAGNVVEGAPTAGIVVGWGRYMRDVSVTGNVVRRAGVGIMITADPKAGSALIAQNLIAATRDGAIRAMETGRPVGPDLARVPTTSRRITITGNVAVEGAT